MSDIALQDLVEIAERHVRKMYFERGIKEIRPIIHAVKDDGDHVILPLQFSSRFEQQLAFVAAKAVMAEIKAVAYVVLTEGWSAPLAGVGESVPADRMPGGKNYIPPTDRADRIEVLYIAACDAGYDPVFRTYRIIRDERSGKVRKLDADGIVNGRLIGAWVSLLHPDTVGTA